MNKLATIPLQIDETHWTTLSGNDDFNTIRTALSDKDNEIALLKRDVANNKTIRKEAIRLGKNRLQSKLDKVREVVDETKNSDFNACHEILRYIVLQIKQIIGDKK
jgi:hypothetical protein